MKFLKIFFSHPIPFSLVFTVLIISLITLSLKSRQAKDKYIEIEMVSSGGEWWWKTGSPPYWLTNTIQVGDVELGLDGKIDSEIISLKTYEQGNDKFFDVRAKIRVSKNKKTNSIKYKGVDINVGDPITVKPQSKTITGNIVWIEGLPDQRQKVNLKVVVKTYSRYPYEADAIQIGSSMTDGYENEIAKVVSKSVDLAEMIVTTSNGAVLVRHNPSMRDITLTLEIKAIKNLNQLFFADNQQVKVGGYLWIKTPSINFDEVHIVSISQL